MFSRFAARAMTRDIIPTLPKYMRRQRMSLDATESEPVIPIVTPTFDSAETTSNVIHERSIRSIAATETIPRETTEKYIVAIAEACLTRSPSMRLLKIFVAETCRAEARVPGKPALQTS